MPTFSRQKIPGSLCVTSGYIRKWVDSGGNFRLGSVVMYIRRTSIKSRRDGESYYTYRLVESVRSDGRVRQRTLLNLGRHFDVPREQWAVLSQRIEQLVGRQSELVPSQLESQWEEMAQRYAAQVIRAKARLDEGRSPEAADYQMLDVDSLDLVRPRGVAVEHVALEALRQVGLDTKLETLGFNGRQQAAAIGTLVGRMTAPGSELATYHWLQHHSGLGELIDYGFLAHASDAVVSYFRSIAQAQRGIGRILICA